MKVFIGADHAGFKLKEKIKRFLEQRQIEVEDLGNLKYDQNDDYPDFSYQVASQVTLNPGSLGILVCGSSFGAAIVANKVKRIRAATAKTAAEARLARDHNDVNVLCLAGGDLKSAVRGIGITFPLAKKIVKVFLATDFSRAKRHQRRVNKIKEIEDKNFY